MAYPTVKAYIDFTSDAFAEAATWVDVTDDVVDIETFWGRSSLVDEFQPGGGRLTLRNESGDYDPTNAAGPYYGTLLPRRRVKVEVPVTNTLIFEDTFADGSIAGTWSLTNPGTISESGSKLHIGAPVTNVTAAAARPALDFTDRHVTIDLDIQTVGPFDGFARPLELSMGGVDVVAFYIERTSTNPPTIGANISIGGDNPGFAAVWFDTYSATDHRYLRIRHHRGRTHWQTSADGVNFVDRMTLDVDWANLASTTVRSYVTRSGASGSFQLNLETFTIRNELVHPLGYGWVSGWPVTQQARKLSEVRVEWKDALAVLARVELEDSVWDWRVKTRSPEAWYRLDDNTSVAVDRSGNGHHGTWRIFSGSTAPWNGETMPDSIAQAGEAPAVVPMAEQAGKSWAKLQAELGQPVGGIVGTPRSPAMVAPASLGQVAEDRSFSVECWVVARQAFPLDVRNVLASVTPIRQPLITFGQPDAQWWEVGISTTGYVYVGAASTSSAWGDLTFVRGILTGSAHHIVVTFTPVGVNTTARVYVDGVEVGTGVSLGDAPVPVGSRPVIGFAMPSTTSGGERSLQSVVGDVVFHAGVLTADEINLNYHAGGFGSVDATILGSELTPAKVVENVLTMIGWGVGHRVQPGVYIAAHSPFDIDAGVLGHRTAIDFIRDVAGSERAPFYQSPDGSLELLTRGWQYQLGRASASQFTFGDRAVDTLGYSELDFTYDDDTVCTEATVRFAGGEQVARDDAAVAVYGPLRDTIDTRLTDPADALQVGWWHVNTRKAPRRLVERPLHLEPVSDAEFDAALRLDFASRVTLARTTADGRVLTGDYWVQALRHRIEPGQLAWDVFVTLEPADVPGPLFRFELGHFDGPEVLAL